MQVFLLLNCFVMIKFLSVEMSFCLKICKHLRSVKIRPIENMYWNAAAIAKWINTLKSKMSSTFYLHLSFLDFILDFFQNIIAKNLKKNLRGSNRYRKMHFVFTKCLFLMFEWPFAEYKKEFDSSKWLFRHKISFNPFLLTFQFSVT